MMNIGDRVRFKNRCSPYSWMTIEAINASPLFGDVRYKLYEVDGWWTAGNLIKV